jgi:hypothetical protein
MENNEDWKVVVWKKIENIFFLNPEFAFLFKIAGGVLLLVIAYFVIKFILPR